AIGASSAQRVAFAQWVGAMVQWTHANDPSHPIQYSEDAGNTGIALLKANAPSLDIYAFNYFDFTSGAELTSALNLIASAWPWKADTRKSWGRDRGNTATGVEDQSAQASRLASLYSIITNVAE